MNGRTNAPRILSGNAELFDGGTADKMTGFEGGQLLAASRSSGGSEGGRSSASSTPGGSSSSSKGMANDGAREGLPQYVLVLLF